MGRKDRSVSGSSPQAATQPTKKPYGRFLRYGLAFLLGAAAAGGAAFILYQHVSAPPAVQTTSAPPQKVHSLGELLAMTPDELAKLDIAEMNLLCATGLPGAENMDIGNCLATVDRWAERVNAETERHLYRLTDPRYKDHAQHYNHSEARFRAEWLISVLQQDVGLHYHSGFALQDETIPPFRTSKQAFLHGLMDNEDARKAFGGNCVSLPVAYAAVGRRLGYPVKLVCSKEHVFCRWEGTDQANPAWRERFNFDGAGDGFSIDPDEFYLSWPRKTRPDQVVLHDWLKSLTPQQELSLFLMTRGHILRDVKKDYDNAQVAYAHAVRYWPTSRKPLYHLTEMVEEHWKVEMAAHPDIYPKPAQQASAFGDLPPRAKPVRDPLADIEMINEINRRNMQRMMQPPLPPPASPYGPRPGVPQPYGLPMPGQPPR